MPTTVAGISVAQAQDLLQRQDRVLRRFPEVESVMGKRGAPRPRPTQRRFP